MLSDYIYNTENKNRFADIIKFIKSNKFLNNANKNIILNYLNNLKKNKIISFCNDKLLEEVIYTYINEAIKGLKFSDCINISEYLYRENVLDENSEIEINNYIGLFKLVSKYYSLILEIHDGEIFHIVKIDYINNIYNFFENANNAKLIIIKIIQNEIKSDIILKSIYECMKKTHRYYTDEYTFARVMINVIDELESLSISNSEEIENYIHNQIKLAKKQAGIYEVDEEKLQTLEEKIKELENKLDSIEKAAEKNSNNYAQIEVEAKTKTILSDISNFKIIDISEEEQIKKLLQKAKIYYNHFKSGTNDTSWFCPYVIDKLGTEFVVNSPPNFINYIYKKGLIDELSNILKINPHFYLENAGWFNKEIIEMFGIKLIATQFNESVQNFINCSFDETTYPSLKKIIEINPNFITQIATLERDAYVHAKMLDLEYIAYIDMNKVKTDEYFSKCNKISKLASISKINNTFFINDCIETTDEQSIVYLKKNTIESIINILNINEIIKMFDNNSINYKKLCNCLIIARSMNFSYDSLTMSFLSLSDEYREQIFNIPNLEQDDISNLDNIQKKEIIRELQRILNNYKKQTRRKRLIFNRGKK